MDNKACRIHACLFTRRKRKYPPDPVSAKKQIELKGQYPPCPHPSLISKLIENARLPEAMKISEQIDSSSVLFKANLVPINRLMLIISEYSQASFHCWNMAFMSADAQVMFMELSPASVCKTVNFTQETAL